MPSPSQMPSLALRLASGRQRLAKFWDRGALEIRLADALGCASLGRSTEPWKNALAAYTDVSGPCAAWGTSASLPSEVAAFINGIALRGLDFNDTYISRETIHPSDVVPSVVAAAETSDCTNRVFLEGLAIGYEAVCRLADEVALRERGIDGATLVGLAASLAASWIFELDDESTAEAVSIVASGGGGLLRTRLGGLNDWKNAAAARMGSDGLAAVRLAKAGISGPAQVFEGKGGFCDVVSGPFEISLDDRCRLERTIVKRFPAQIFLQAPIQLALDLRNEVPSDRVERIEIATYRYAVESTAQGPEKWAPSTVATADHSMPFCVAAAWLWGKIDGRTFHSLNDERLLEMVERIDVLEDPNGTAAFPDAFYCRVSVETTDGFYEYRDTRRLPSISDEELPAKFRAVNDYGELLGHISQLTLQPGGSGVASLVKAIR